MLLSLSWNDVAGIKSGNWERNLGDVTYSVTHLHICLLHTRIRVLRHFIEAIYHILRKVCSHLNITMCFKKFIIIKEALMIIDGCAWWAERQLQSLNGMYEIVLYWVVSVDMKEFIVCYYSCFMDIVQQICKKKNIEVIPITNSWKCSISLICMFWRYFCAFLANI